MADVGVRENVRTLVLIACFLVEVRARVQPNLSLEQGCPSFLFLQRVTNIFIDGSRTANLKFSISGTPNLNYCEILQHIHT